MTPLLLGLALTLGAPAPKEAPKKDPPKLEGEWVVESFEPKKEAPPGGATMRITADKLIVIEGKREKPEEATYTVDLTKKPAHIDLRPEKGKKDLVIQGIFEVTGDTLKLAFGFDGSERPTEFKADLDKKVGVITLKRVKPEK